MRDKKNWYCHCSYDKKGRRYGYCWNCYIHEYLTENGRIKLDISTTIQDMRLGTKITQKQLAQRTGMHQSAISRFENSEEIPTLTQALKIAKALGLNLQVRVDEKIPKNINIVAQNSATEESEVSFL